MNGHNSDNILLLTKSTSSTKIISPLLHSFNKAKETE